MVEVNQQSLLVNAGGPLSRWWDNLVYFCRRYPLGAFGGTIMIMFLLVAVFAELVATHDPTRTNAAVSLFAPNMNSIMGNDFMGRDVFSRIVFGARISLIVAVSSTLMGGITGLVIGLISGYLLGWWDLIIQRVMDIMQALPLLVMALVMAASLGPSLENTIIAISIPLVPRAARVIRASTLTIREMPFVEAARAMGMGEMRIAFFHVLPNTLAPFIVLATAQLGAAVLVEASLSFLGLGVPEPHPSWGRMLSESAAEYVREAPWLVIFPGLVISAAVFGINLLGDAMRDSLDPRLRQ